MVGNLVPDVNSPCPCWWRQLCASVFVSAAFSSQDIPEAVYSRKYVRAEVRVAGKAVK